METWQRVRRWVARNAENMLGMETSLGTLVRHKQGLAELRMLFKVKVGVA